MRFRLLRYIFLPLFCTSNVFPCKKNVLCMFPSNFQTSKVSELFFHLTHKQISVCVCVINLNDPQIPSAPTNNNIYNLLRQINTGIQIIFFDCNHIYFLILTCLRLITLELRQPKTTRILFLFLQIKPKCITVTDVCLSGKTLS